MRYAPNEGRPLAHGPAVEEAIRRFHATGRSFHTPDSPLLPSVLNALQEAGVSFVLSFVSGQGYMVERGPASLTGAERLVRREWVVARCSGDPRPMAGLTGV